MNNIVIGKYLNHDSFVHRADPRIKLIILLLFMVSILLPVGWIGYLILSIISFALLKLAKIKFSYVWKMFKPMLFMMCFLLVINILTATEGKIIFSLGFIDVRLSAIIDTLYIVVRLFLMIGITSIITASTKPLDLTVAIEDLLSPFNRFGFPSHIIAMIISIALRFIPTLIEEVNRIMKAQASRGVDYENMNFINKIKSLFSLIIPLFMSAFSKADDLSQAMEARGYVPDSTRTRYKQYIIKTSDWIFLSIAVLVLIVEIVIAIWL